MRKSSAGEVTWKLKTQVYYSITNNLIPKAIVLVPQDQLNQIKLRNERKDLMAMDLTTGSLTKVWHYIYVGMQGTCLAISA